MTHIEILNQNLNVSKILYNIHQVRFHLEEIMAVNKNSNNLAYFFKKKKNIKNSYFPHNR